MFNLRYKILLDISYRRVYTASRMKNNKQINKQNDFRRHDNPPTDSPEKLAKWLKEHWHVIDMKCPCEDYILEEEVIIL